MKECDRFKRCPLIDHCTENEETVSMSLDGMIRLYCCGSKQLYCIRKQLLVKFGETSVPKDMMPNGFPLPGANREKWSEEAINFRVLL